MIQIAYSSYLRKFTNPPIFVLFRFCGYPTLTMMHLCTMLYTYWYVYLLRHQFQQRYLLRYPLQVRKNGHLCPISYPVSPPSSPPSPHHQHTHCRQGHRDRQRHHYLHQHHHHFNTVQQVTTTATTANTTTSNNITNTNTPLIGSPPPSRVGLRLQLKTTAPILGQPLVFSSTSPPMAPPQFHHHLQHQYPTQITPLRSQRYHHLHQYHHLQLLITIIIEYL